MHVRPAKLDEAKVLRDLHDESIRGLCRAEYTAAEIAAWAAPKSLEAYAADIARHVFIVAEDGSRVVGFGALAAEDGVVLAVYAAPDLARQGVGTLILQELERVARGLGIPQLALKSSLTAEPFYRAHRYVQTGHCTHQTGDQALKCIEMRKSL